jgi:hypothetical protein
MSTKKKKKEQSLGGKRGKQLRKNIKSFLQSYPKA